MPTCVSCGAWAAPSAVADGTQCPDCGGELEAGTEAAAASLGMTREAFLEKLLRERATRQRQAAAARRVEEEARRALPLRWDHTSTPESAGLFGLFFIGLPLTLLSGVAIFVVFLLQGLPAWIALVATPVGFVGGWFVCWGIEVAAYAVIGWLAYRSTWFDRHGEDLYRYQDLISSVVIPPLFTIGVAVVLLCLVG